MIMTIWILPLLVAIGTTVFFNKKTGNKTIQTRFVFFTVLDIINTYAFVMIPLHLAVKATPSLMLSIIFIFVFLFGMLLHLRYSNQHTNDGDSATETLKNNIIVQGTTIVPFLVFIYVFRSIDSYLLSIVYSILLAVLIFVFSLLLKRISIKLIGGVTRQAEMTTGISLTLLYSLVAIVIVAMLSIMLTTMKSNVPLYTDFGVRYDISVLDKRDVFDWDNVSIIESIIVTNSSGDLKQTKLLIQDQYGLEWFVVLGGLDTRLRTFTYYPLANTLPLTPLEEKTSNTRLVDDSQTYIATNDGLYMHIGNTMSVVPDTENKKVEHITYHNEHYFLLHNGVEDYTLINSTNEVVDTITTQEVTVINNHLFLVDSSNYIDYNNPASIFPIIENTTPFYNATSGVFYQVENTNGKTTVHMSNETDPHTISLLENDNIIIVPLQSETLYIAHHFAFRDKETNLDNTLTVNAILNSTGAYDTFVRYQADTHLVEFVDDTHISILKVEQEDGTIYISAGFYTFEGNTVKLAENTTKLIVRYSVVIFICLFAPLTNYEKYTKISSFNKLAYKENKNRE